MRLGPGPQVQRRRPALQATQPLLYVGPTAGEMHAVFGGSELLVPFFLWKAEKEASYEVMLHQHKIFIICRVFLLIEFWFLLQVHFE